jgi:molybdate transport system substrate-binding protein
MRRLRPFALLALVLALVGVFGSPPPRAVAAPAAQGTTELTVFAAASLTDAYRQIGRNFEKANPGVTVTFNFAGSQQLATQLGQGAPADVFASANTAQMNVAVNAGRIAKDASTIFVLNRLLVVTSPSSKLSITKLQDLAKPGLKLVFAAKAVPVGQYTLDFLDKAVRDPAFGSAYKDNVLKNVVSYEENVRSVLTKISLGEGDAGVVYVSDVVSSPKTPVKRLDIPPALNVIAFYPIAPVGDSKHAALAQKFVDYMFAGDTRLTLARYGFTLPALYSGPGR